MAKKSKHRQYGQLKTQISASLTPEATEGLDVLADQLGLSRSELLEQIGRGLIPVNSSPLVGEF